MTTILLFSAHLTLAAAERYGITNLDVTAFLFASACVCAMVSISEVLRGYR